MKFLPLVLISSVFAGCYPVYLDEERSGGKGRDGGDDDDDDNDGDDDDDNKGDDDDDAGEDEDEDVIEGPDLGDVDFSIHIEQLSTFIDRFSQSTEHVVEICFDSAQGEGVSAANTGDATVSGYFEVAIGLYRWDDDLWEWSDGYLWSDIAIEPGERVYWNGPFCTSIGMFSDLDPKEYSVVMLVDAWDDIEESDEENNLAATESFVLEAMGDASNM